MPAISNKTHSILVIIGTTILFASLYTYIFDKKLDLNGDNANYYMLGKALASGDGYVNVNTITKSPNNHFPPGYPALISSTILVFGDSTTALKLLNGALFLLTLFAIYYLTFRITARKSTAIIVVLLLMLNSHLLRYSTMIMSEVPYLFFSTFAILSFIKVNYSKPPWKDPWFYLALALLIIAFYIRTSGVALIGGIILFLLIIKQWKHAVVLSVVIFLLALPWQIRSQQLGGSSYVKQLVMVNPYRPELGKAELSNFAERFTNNFSRYITKEIPSASLSFLKPDYLEASSLGEWLLGLLFITIIIYGILLIKRFKFLILAYLAGTFAILLLWPDVWVGVRFLLPAVPFLLIGLVSGLQELILKMPKKKIVAYLIWMPILICLLFIPKLKPLHEQAIDKLRANWANYFSLAKWSKDNLGSDVVIACRKPTMFYLYSGTYTTNYKYTENHQELIDNLMEKQVDYVVLEQLGYSSTYRYLLPAVQANPDKFVVIRKLNGPETYLLRLIKP